MSVYSQIMKEQEKKKAADNLSKALAESEAKVNELVGDEVIGKTPEDIQKESIAAARRVAERKNTLGKLEQQMNDYPPYSPASHNYYEKLLEDSKVSRVLLGCNECDFTMEANMGSCLNHLGQSCSWPHCPGTLQVVGPYTTTKAPSSPPHDPVNHPKHYTSHPSGVEAITICEHMGFNLGNAMKYLFRSELKGKQVEDLKKAVFYINREIERLEKKEDHGV